MEDRQSIDYLNHSVQNVFNFMHTLAGIRAARGRLKAWYKEARALKYKDVIPDPSDKEKTLTIYKPATSIDVIQQEKPRLRVATNILTHMRQLPPELTQIVSEYTLPKNATQVTASFMFLGIYNTLDEMLTSILNAENEDEFNANVREMFDYCNKSNVQHVKSYIEDIKTWKWTDINKSVSNFPSGTPVKLIDKLMKSLLLGVNDIPQILRKNHFICSRDLEDAINRKKTTFTYDLSSQNSILDLCDVLSNINKNVFEVNRAEEFRRDERDLINALRALH